MQDRSIKNLSKHSYLLHLKVHVYFTNVWNIFWTYSSFYSSQFIFVKKGEVNLVLLSSNLQYKPKLRVVFIGNT